MGVATATGRWEVGGISGCWNGAKLSSSMHCTASGRNVGDGGLGFAFRDDEMVAQFFFGGDQTSSKCMVKLEGFSKNIVHTSDDRDEAGHFFVCKVQCPFPCVWVAGPDMQKQRHVVQVVSGREKRYASIYSNYFFRCF